MVELADVRNVVLWNDSQNTLRQDLPIERDGFVDFEPFEELGDQS